jgi:TonB family protein
MFRKALITCSLAVGLACAHAQSGWPERHVRIEDMKPLTRMKIAVPVVRQLGEVKGPVILRAHVDATGAVRRVALLESCGSTAHDEAALHAMRAMRFAPKVEDGEAVEVTLVVPLHLPLTKAAGSP